MFKSVFQKIFFTYLFILVAIMLTLTFFLTTIANNYVYNQKHNLLNNVGVKANALANAYELGTIDHAQLIEALNAMGYTVDTKIYIIKADIAALSTIDLGEELDDPYLDEALTRVLNGESVFSQRQYSKEFEAQVVFAAYPWRDASGIRGAILMFSPEHTVSTIVGNIRLIIALLAAAFMFMGGIVIFVYSRRLVRPIREIDEASRLMAQGEDAPDIKIRTRDELGALANSFNTMKQKILKNERLRSELLSNISHDLRTPITTISGFAGGMADGVIKESDYKKYIGIIRSEAKRLGSLTEGILESAKIQAGNLELNIASFPLQRAVRDAIEANANAAAEKRIKLKTEIPPNLTINADERKLQQVLYNLINNAVKYSQTGGTVTISATGGDDHVEVSVLDYGEGIALSDLPHVFNRYYRSDNAKIGGYGLGLSIVKTYVEAHGGTVCASSNKQDGTRFVFTIPNVL